MRATKTFVLWLGICGALSGCDQVNQMMPNITWSENPDTSPSAAAPHSQDTHQADRAQFGDDMNIMSREAAATEQDLLLHEQSMQTKRLKMDKESKMLDRQEMQEKRQARIALDLLDRMYKKCDGGKDPIACATFQNYWGELSQQLRAIIE